ncbi:hypothetical protein BD410DRAFT_839085 [Rickenella mellea]|uniref:Uncharacterized protein n=1 Tax=Rickenella mellea TaxID=50990 RepID=A0A4Y7Q6W2_9AGAM|nr:hypothetical protein BD410DRAFT_839085 [Rickenella mellea]
MPTSPLLEFARIPFDDFEGCLDFVERHSGYLDFEQDSQIFLWQAVKIHERLFRNQIEEHLRQEVLLFLEQCVQRYMFLKWGSECGIKRLKTYIRRLVLTPQTVRYNYLSGMLILHPTERLVYLNEWVPFSSSFISKSNHSASSSSVMDYFRPLRLFCILYDYTYEEVEKAARARLEETFMNKLQHRLEPLKRRRHNSTT